MDESDRRRILDRACQALAALPKAWAICACDSLACGDVYPVNDLDLAVLLLPRGRDAGQVGSDPADRLSKLIGFRNIAIHPLPGS